MVKIALAIEREVEDTRSIWDMGVSAKRKKNQSSSSSRKKQKTSVLHRSQGQGQAKGTDDMLLLPSAWTYETGLPSEARIPELWDTIALVVSETCVDIVCSFSPQYRPEEPVSIPRCCTSAFCYTEGP